jgi:hypothetical protein
MSFLQLFLNRETERALLEYFSGLLPLRVAASVAVPALCQYACVLMLQHGGAKKAMM